jgi:hypothetical protein
MVIFHSFVKLPEGNMMQQELVSRAHDPGPEPLKLCTIMLHFPCSSNVKASIFQVYWRNHTRLSLGGRGCSGRPYLAKFHYFTDQTIISLFILWRGNGIVIMYQMIIEYDPTIG